MTASRVPFVYRYLITESTFPQMPVGAAVVDRGNQLQRTWTIYSRDKGDFMMANGTRAERMCYECFDLYERGKTFAANTYGHEGKHGVKHDGPALSTLAGAA